MNIKQLIVLFVLFSAVAATRAFAEEADQKYKDVFYPDGMPVYSELEDGQTQHYPTVYKLCAELDVPNSNIKVVVFDVIDNIFGLYEDNPSHLFISILQPNGDNWDIICRKDITNYIKLSLDEDDGEVDINDIGCLLDYYNLANHDAVHLSFQADISGTGGMSSGSDIIFFIQNNELVPVFEQLGDISTASTGSEASLHSSSYLSYVYIYLADVDSDGTKEILTHIYIAQMEDGAYSSDGFIDAIYVNKFDSGQNKYIYTGKITSLPSDAIKLRRPFEPTVPAEGIGGGQP
jgi:hypothetical protein